VRLVIGGSHEPPAPCESHLRAIYENLSTHLVFRKEETEITTQAQIAARIVPKLTPRIHWFHAFCYNRENLSRRGF
jgi:hypothetical protein